MKKILSSLLIMFVFLLGTNNVKALDVSQVSLNVEDKSSTIIVIDEGIGTLEVNPKIEFNVVGDFITYKLVLKNNDGKKYKIESVTDNNTNEHIKVEYDYNKDMNTDNKTILITLKYDKKITDPSTELKNIKVSIKLIDEDDNTQDIDVNGGNNTGGSTNTRTNTNNNASSPQTGDNVQTHVWLLFISLIGFVLSIIYLIKNKGKKYNKGLLSILLLLTLIPTIVFASEMKEIIFNINFNNIKINIKHKVEFDTKGAGEIETQVVEDNEKATKPANPIKEHYNFVKWLNEENSEFNFTNTNVTKDIKLSALWEKKEYTISYETDGGTSKPQDQKVKYNETFDEPSKPTKNHYVFKKWVDENNEEYDFSTKATRNITLTALWDKEEYTITFETDGGTPKLEDQKVLYKDKVTKPSNPTKNKHDFDGWLDEQGNLYNFDSEVTKNMTLTAKWTELFTVTYEPNNGSTIPSETVRKNGKFKEPQKPSKDHYNFERWYIDATFTTHYDFNEEVTSDKELYAKYTPIEYTITYKLNDGNVSTPNKDKYTIETDDFTLNNPTPPNDKRFKGWKKNNETTVNENVTIIKGTTGNLEFEAIFNPIYTVTYDVNGGNAITPTSKQIENGEEIGTLPTPTKDHYDFAGWYIGNKEIESDYIVEGNITIVAKYTPIEYTITYNLNGGTVANANPTTYTIETPDFTLNNPTPPNDKRFKGWKKNNETTVNENVTITKGTTGNLEFEAIYKTLFTVTFDADIGTIPTSDATREVESGSKLGTLPTPTPPTGKVLEGWYIETTLIDSNYTVNKDVTIKAKYKDVANVTDLVDPDDPEVITDDYGNDRFTGFDPKNYIYYNCKTEPTSSWTDNDYKNSCELWRILGTFDNVEDAQGKKEKRAKIIRDDYLPGNYAWDSSVSNINSGGGINEWSQADLMYELNGDYLDYTKTGTTTWYNGSKNKKTEPYDYKYSLSRYAQTLIKEADWWYGYTNIYNGGFSFPIMNSEKRKFMKVARVYELERTEYNVKEKTGATYDSLARGTKIFKVVGLPSLSDYGYATSGDNDESIRLGCLNSDLEYDYGVFSGKKCHMYNWLHNGTKAVWTINRLYDFPAPQNSGVWAIATRGGIISYPASGSMVSSTTYEFYVRPTVFLKKNVVAIGGTGTKTDPYKITLMN